VQRFRGGLVFKAHRLVYHSTLGLRVIKKKKTDLRRDWEVGVRLPSCCRFSAGMSSWFVYRVEGLGFRVNGFKVNVFRVWVLASIARQHIVKGVALMV